MPRAERNRRLFASAIAGSEVTTSRRTTEPIVIEEERITTRTETSNYLFMHFIY
jgi:hypothetical protein